MWFALMESFIMFDYYMWRPHYPTYETIKLNALEIENISVWIERFMLRRTFVFQTYISSTYV